MSKITITRSSEWTNRLRPYHIYLDDQKIGSIANGEVKTFEVPPGNHRLTAKIDWCSSRQCEFIVSGGEMKYFHLSAFKWAKIIMPFALVFIVAHFLLRRLAGIDYLIWFVVPVFLVLLYFITIGRKDYLLLKPADSF